MDLKIILYTRRVLYVLLFANCVIFYNSSFAQTITQPVNDSAWIKPYPPFRIVGNLYYVGTYDAACYLIVTDKGNILINTGLESSLPIISNNIKELGFEYDDIKILLTNQAHYDHVGAMADIKKETGAQFWSDFSDAEVLKDGGSSDYELNYLGTTFKPVMPDRLLKDKDIIELGDTKLMLLHHSGHTKGSCSYLLNVKDNHKVYRVFIANIPTIITEKKFSDVKLYPEIQKDYAYTLAAMKKLKFDIWVAAHASQFDLHQKRNPTTPYNPKIFMDKKGYDKRIQNAEKAYKEKLKELMP